MTQSALAKTISAVRSAFRGYYFKPNMIETPDMIEQREFGYMQFGQVGMVRHLSFNSMKELTATIIKEAPADIYCSNAYYRFPTYPMQEKQWLGADLIFDIDGKDLHLPCVSSHSYFVCANCGRASASAPFLLCLCKLRPRVGVRASRKERISLPVVQRQRVR